MTAVTETFLTNDDRGGVLSVVGYAHLLRQRVEGWCYYVGALERRATVELLVDGVVIRTVRATLYRVDLQSIGVGDGYYGFDLALELDKLGGSRATVELRERDRAVLFGRFIINQESIPAARNNRLDTAERKIDALYNSVYLYEQDLIRLAFGEIGRLVASVVWRPELEARPRVGATWHANKFRPIDLSVYRKPTVSVIVTLGETVESCVDAIEFHRACLKGAPAEIVVIDSGHDPRVAMLPQITKHLQIFRGNGVADCRELYNEVLLFARGDMCAFVENAQRGSGDVLLDVLSVTEMRDAYIYRDIDEGGSSQSDTWPARRASGPPDGVLAVLPRESMINMGGFSLCREGRECLIWRDLARQLEAVGIEVVTTSVHVGLQKGSHDDQT